MKKADTSWGKVADWYDEYLDGADSYQRVVILPNLLRILNPKKGDKVLDLACGQGFFTEEIVKTRADVIGIDISSELIAKAESRFRDKGMHAKFLVSPADNLSAIASDSLDSIACVLAAQNIKELDKVFAECARTLKSQGRLVLVLNHPAYRIPQQSDWHYEEALKGVAQGSNAAAGIHPHPARQGRVVYQYMSEAAIKIDMNPGTRPGSGAKKYTLSYHRPLQVFIKWLTKKGFAITRLEEWTSHKKSAPGPKAKVEDEARKEIPMFMCIEATLIK